MFEGCLTIGFAMIVTAMMLTVIRSGKEHRRPNISDRRQSASAPSQAIFDDPWELNFDAFADPELAVNTLKTNGTLDLKCLDDDPESDDSEDAEPSSSDTPQPMVLASLLEIQSMEEAAHHTAAVPQRPKILGDTACELGIRYFDYLIGHHTVPRGDATLTNDTNILIAKNALKTSHPSATFSHGAVAQRIGEHAVCLFEPLETPVVNLDKALDQIAELLDGKAVFVILSDTDNADAACLAHLGPLCKKYRISKTNVYIEQPDGEFINYIEDIKNFVPSRLNADLIPQNFFVQLFDYAQLAYDETDYEAVLRCLAPLIPTLYSRARSKRSFPPLLAAQALNLIGMTYRDIGNDDQAVTAFDMSLTLLREIEDYEAIKAVAANLGITLALSHPLSLPKIERAIRLLNEVTQLNPRDDEAWLYLANSYLEQYRFTNAHSLLGRALRAYNRAYELAPTDDIGQCIAALQRQIDGSSSQRAAYAAQARQASSFPNRENISQR